MEAPGTKKITAIVLAGGKSTRMKGTDKSMLPLRGIPMIAHIVRQLEPCFGEIIIGANDMNKYSFLGHRVVPDEEQGRGPLMGIYCCLMASASDLNFVTACDIPDINISLISELLVLSDGADIVMPVTGVDLYEPLYALYRKSVIPIAAGLLKKKKSRISDLFLKAKTRFVTFDGRGWYHNINEDKDYLSYNGSLR